MLSNEEASKIGGVWINREDPIVDRVNFYSYKFEGIEDEDNIVLYFELAIDELRKGSIGSYNKYARAAGFSELNHRFKLPYIGAGVSYDDLQKLLLEYKEYKKFIESTE